MKNQLGSSVWMQVPDFEQLTVWNYKLNFLITFIHSLVSANSAKFLDVHYMCDYMYAQNVKRDPVLSKSSYWSCSGCDSELRTGGAEQSN